MKQKKKVIGLLIFAMVIAVFLVNPMTYTDFFQGFRLERSIRKNKVEFHHFSVFHELSVERASKILLEHGDKLLELGFYKEIIELEDLNEAGELNNLIAEAYYLEWLSASIDEPFRLDHYLVYADKLTEGKVDRYFMPLYIRRAFSPGSLYQRKDYITEDFRAVYNELLAKEIKNSLVYIMDSDVIYSQDSNLWWVPEGIDINHEKDLAIKTFLKELRDLNEECFNRVIYHLVNNDSRMQSYLKELGTYQYYNKSLEKVDFIHSQGQLLIINRVPYLYVQGEKYNEKLDKLIRGYFKINLNTQENEFLESKSQVAWRYDGNYAFSRGERLIYDENNPADIRFEVDIAIYDKSLQLLDFFTLEIENQADIRWVEGNLYINDFGTTKAYNPETATLIDIARPVETRFGNYRGLIISTGKISRGFSFFSQEGDLLYETDKMVITNSVNVKNNNIIYQTLDDIGIYFYCIENEKLSYVATPSRFITAIDNYLIVLHFIDDYLSVLAKMDLSGEIIETYPFYNNTEIIESKGTKLLNMRAQYGTN